MTKFQYILKTFIHYFKANLLVALGVAVSATVLTGSLIIGDSIRYSLKQTTFSRLGETTHLVSVVDRYFRQEMATEIEADNPEIKAAPVLLLEGVAVANGGQQRVNRVQIVGVGSGFEKIAKTTLFSELRNNEIAISHNLAERLKIEKDASILVRIKKASLIPLNAPFVSAEETSVSMRATVKKVIQKEEMGRFNLKNSQTAPYNIFVSIHRLNELMEFVGKANQLLISTDLKTEKVAQSVKNCLTPADAGLIIKNIESTGEVEISTERVFLEKKVAETLKKLPGAKPILTYFVNEIGKKGTEKESDAKEGEDIPYSFVSSLGNEQLKSNEIIINQWAADELKAKPGDVIWLKYFEIGPLRKLVDAETDFILKAVIPMDSDLIDPSRIPHLPGLSDAGHCREWEAGVPINLDAIRDKDEDYWNKWQGAPKAFVSTGKALEMWSNRFGNYTAVRFPGESFDKEKYNQVFAQEISPSDLGIAIEPIREQGLNAAENGTDFSGLFLGLSFFILVASIVLTALLFRLNIETRSAQVGVLAALGFKQNQVRRFFMLEGFSVALFGGLIGMLVSVFYTSLVFRVLNTLWFEIVRTNMLEVQVIPGTLIIGLVISLLVSMVAIYISIKRFQDQQAAERKKHLSEEKVEVWNLLKELILFLSVSASLAIFVLQIVIFEQPNPLFFFLSGGLLLLGMFLIFRRMLFRIEFREQDKVKLGRLWQLNLARNKGRSLTVVTLFALGTFMVTSVGSNKLDLFANASEKSSGTGGFLYFAETTMPVLFNLNDSVKRAEEGIYEDFSAVQFRKLEGDDASCLNLNRIKQPALLGVNPESLKGRFSFASRLKELGDAETWSILNENFKDGTIPAIADQTVIQYGLGTKVGNILLYQNELGDTLRLKLIAGTAPSIFQGYVIISNKHFLENYPTSSGTNLFLIDGNPVNKIKIGAELLSIFRDYGLELEDTAKRLVEFYSVTNTYLSIFLALGALGLILGTIGLAVILARTILERRREIAVMQAIGFSNRSIFHILVNEYLILLFAGVFIGSIAALIAILPAFLSSSSDASVGTVFTVVSIVLINGIIWIIGLILFSLRKKVLATSLRVE